MMALVLVAKTLTLAVMGLAHVAKASDLVVIALVFVVKAWVFEVMDFVHMGKDMNFTVIVLVLVVKTWAFVVMALLLLVSLKRDGYGACGGSLGCCGDVFCAFDGGLGRLRCWFWCLWGFCGTGFWASCDDMGFLLCRL
jgi:hypothetical protein